MDISVIVFAHMIGKVVSTGQPNLWLKKIIKSKWSAASTVKPPTPTKIQSGGVNYAYY